jgi:hypothetical protein
MSTGIAASPRINEWRALYKAAIFETDKSRLSERLARAEWALVLRARELFHAGGETFQERQAIDAAVYALYVLRRSTISVEERKGPQLLNPGVAHAA